MLIGNLTRDPNFRYTPNNTAVCSFGIATNRSWASSDGVDKQEQVEYHNIVAWRKLADICGQLLHKGDKVFVEGRLQTREWKGEDGSDKRMTEVVIDNMILLKSRSGAAGGSANYQSDDNTASPSDTSSAQATSSQTDDVADVEDIADDVPF